MPGRFFEISVNPATATVPPGGTTQLTYKVKNIIGRPVSAQFVIVSPSPAEGSWATVSNGAMRQFTLDGSQDFVVAVSPGKTTPSDQPGQNHQFAVYVKDQADPERTFDQGPPFTVTVKSTGGGGGGVTPPWWKKFVIPGAIGAGVLVVAAVLLVVFRHPKVGPLPIVVGLPANVASDTLKAHGYTDTLAGTVMAAGKAAGTVVQQTPASDSAAAKDTVFQKDKRVQLVIAAPSVELPDLHGMASKKATDTIQALTLLIGALSTKVSTVATDQDMVLDQAPPKGTVPAGTSVNLTIGVFQPPTGPPVKCVPISRCIRIDPQIFLQNNKATMERLRLPPAK